MKLSNKKAIITGANRSLGREIALTFAREGADVAISYRTDQTGAQETVEEMKNMGRQAAAFYAEFDTIPGVSHFFDQAFNFLGRVDILVNNAAAYDTSSFLDLSVEQFERLFKIGVSAPMLLSQLTARKMIQSGIAGSMINISSITGQRPYLNRVANSTTKGALNSLTLGSALDLAPHHIRVNAIAPGTVPYDPSEKFNEKIPLGRFGKTQDIAQAALYLASEDSSWVTGQILTVDGGQSLSFN